MTDIARLQRLARSGDLAAAEALAVAFRRGARAALPPLPPSVCGGDLAPFHSAARGLIQLRHGDFVFPQRDGLRNGAADRRLRDLMRAVAAPCLTRFGGSICAIYHYRAPLCPARSSLRRCVNYLGEPKLAPRARCQPRSKIWAV